MRSLKSTQILLTSNPIDFILPPYRYADSPKALSHDAERLFEQKIMKDQELARKTEELYTALAKKNREIEK